MYVDEIGYIFKYLNKYLPEPTGYIFSKEFIDRSYARWAIYELIDYILDNSNKPFNDLFDEFSLIMSHCYRASTFDRRYQIAINITEKIRKYIP